MGVHPQHRFTRDRRCPICGGYDELDRGTGRRCWGFLSDDGAWAHCTRQEYGGDLPVHVGSETYAHRLTGECRCGRTHDTVPALPAPSGPARWRSRSSSDTPRGTWDCTYLYRGADGQPLHRTVRFRDPKSFRQQRWESGRWHWGLGTVEPVLYRLPELLAAHPDEPIYVVEGEKDADRLAALGLVATTTVCGTARWQPRYSRWIAGRAVIVIADNDEPGMRRGSHVAHALAGIALSVVLYRVDGAPSADISDWLDAGGTIDDLRAVTSRELAVSA